MSVTQSSPTILNRESAFATASIGKKILVAVSGAVLVGFVIGHMLGNLQIFIGQNAINRYAKALQDLGPILWVIRAFLIATVIVHIWVTVLLWFQNKAARPVAYKMRGYRDTGISSRFMIYSGLALFFFILFHLMHYTFLWVHPEYHNLIDSQGRHDVYSMMIMGFSYVSISIVYILAMFFLALHINHATFSLFQTLGWCNEKWELRLQRLSIALAVVLFVGYVSIPTAVLAGFLTLPGGGM